MSFAMAELYPPSGPPCGWFYLLDREIGEFENVPAIADIADGYGVLALIDVVSV